MLILAIHEHRKSFHFVSFSIPSIPSFLETEFHCVVLLVLELGLQVYYALNPAIVRVISLCVLSSQNLLNVIDPFGYISVDFKQVARVTSQSEPPIFFHIMRLPMQLVQTCVLFAFCIGFQLKSVSVECLPASLVSVFSVGVRGVFELWRHGCSVFSALQPNKQIDYRDLVPAPSLSSFIGTLQKIMHLIISAALSNLFFSSKNLWVFFPPCYQSFLFSRLLDLVVYRSGFRHFLLFMFSSFSCNTFYECSVH